MLFYSFAVHNELVSVELLLMLRLHLDVSDVLFIQKEMDTRTLSIIISGFLGIPLGLSVYSQEQLLRSPAPIS